MDKKINNNNIDEKQNISVIGFLEIKDKTTGEVIIKKRDEKTTPIKNPFGEQNER